MSKLPEYFSDIAIKVNNKLDQLLDINNTLSVRLIEAMRHSTLSTGKMLRPTLVIKSAELFNVNLETSLNIAAAVELAHVYSLIHDDLPSMDNDDMRRGKASCHIAHGEAAAILAGNSLLTLAFELIASSDTPFSDHIVRELIYLFSKALGHQGLLAGQMLDIDSQNSTYTIEQIALLQELKTARLFAFACEAGAIIGGANLSKRNILKSFGNNLGHAFQIIDDLLDLSGQEALVGKKLGKDQLAGKATYINLIGSRASYQKAVVHIEACIHALEEFGEQANGLRDLAQFIISRES